MATLYDRTFQGNRKRVVTTPGEVWIHIDRLDKPDRAIWAIQEVVNGQPTYRCARSFRLRTPASGRAHEGDGSPRAYVVARNARVRWRGLRAEILPA